MVKCRETFLEKGESGVLVYFLDESGREDAFGYGVGEWFYMVEGETIRETPSTIFIYGPAR